MFLQKSEEKLRKTWKGHYEKILKNPKPKQTATYPNKQLQFIPLSQE